MNLPPAPLVYKTPGFKGSSGKSFPYRPVQFSPFFPEKFAVGSSQNFGIVGNGRLFIFSTQNPAILTFDTQDGIFDIAWSESNENHILAASGDGSIKLFDLHQLSPLKSYHEHGKEVYSVNWNLKQKNLFCSGSWDLTVKLWDLNRDRSLLTIPAHTGCIYETQFSPHDGDIIGSCSGDQFFRVWDIRSSKQVVSVRGHDTEILSFDWGKYKPNTLVTGSVDKTIKYWDLRNPSIPVITLVGHEYAVRKVRMSPFNADIVGSVSYDMTFRLWNLALGTSILVDDFHTEFSTGLDFSLFNNSVATTGWDEMVRIRPTV